MSPSSSLHVTPRCVVTPPWSPRASCGWGPGELRCWWAAWPPTPRSPSPGTWWSGAASPWSGYTTTTSWTSPPRSRSALTILHSWCCQDFEQFLEQSPYREEFRKVVSPPQPMENFEQAFQLAKTGKYQRVLLKMWMEMLDKKIFKYSPIAIFPFYIEIL